MRGIAEDNAALLAAGGFVPAAAEGGAAAGRWQPLPKPAPAELVLLQQPNETGNLFARTEFCVANCDTLSAALLVGNAVALCLPQEETGRLPTCPAWPSCHLSLLLSDNQADMLAC